MIKTKNQSGKTYSNAQRVLSWVVLFGIFICGVMAGAFIWETKTRYTAESGVYTNLRPCEMRENALIANLYTNIDDSNFMMAADAHKHNADIYDKLVKWGCPEHVAKYTDLRDAEFQTFDVLRRIDEKNIEDSRPCAVIEKTLLNNITDSCGDYSECHLRNAAVYSKIVEDGCEEYKQKYAQKALDELQIAEGVRVYDTDVNDSEMRTTVNTYKKLQMQNEARKYIKKMEKLVNPGVDFIMELQRVIEE